MSTPRYIVLVGTDTGVGKTVVGCGLARCLTATGRKVIAIKPVESGTEEVPEEMQDGGMLARATGQAEPTHALTRLRAGVAPPVAAARERVKLDHGEWVDRIRELGAAGEIVLVEGAGGLLSPLTWKTTIREMAADLGARAYLIAPDRLGSLNHVLLTLESMAAASIPLLGVVFSTPEVTDESTGKNAITLKRLVKGVKVVEIPHLWDPADAAEFLEAAAGWIDE